MNKIIHVLTDEKFFDPIMWQFELLDNCQNIYLFYTGKKNYKFTYIKNVDKLTIINDWKELTCLLSHEDVKVIYFHSLPPTVYKWFQYINNDTIVACWFWGYDIYNNNIRKGLIDIELYKPNTKSFFVNNFSLYTKTLFLCKEIIKRLLGLHPSDNLWKKVISRIDYTHTVLPIEHTILQNNVFFRAQYYCLPISLDITNNTDKEYQGNILFGNSATPTNNHMDVLAVLSNIPKLGGNRQFIIPINYGDDRYKKYVKNDILKYTQHNFNLIEKFMPIADYSTLIDSCDYAIMGHIRQQAMGNISMCLLKGVKIFLYKDSITYKQLAEIDGYKIFTIDNDLTYDGLCTPLSVEDKLYNKNKYLSKLTHRSEMKNAMNFLFKSFTKNTERGVPL